MVQQRGKAGVLLEARAAREEPNLELIDVPAAVVCAVCGQPDCAGCSSELNETTHGSGVIAIVPWERPGLGLFDRLWSTARLATMSCEAFFGRLPEGELIPALRFAMVAELFALSGFAIALAPLVLFVTPGLRQAIVESAELRGILLRGLIAGIPLLASAMVGLHALHGWALDYAARRAGSTRRRPRGVRFGLYSCGWDLVTLPLGLALVAIRDGFGSARRAAPLGLTAPISAANAYLRGVHQLSDDQARSAARFGNSIAFGTALAVVLTAVTAVTLLAWFAS